MTNIVFNSNNVRNFTDRTPARGVSCGRIGRGPFTKNLVIPNEPLNRLRNKEKAAKGISVLLSPKLSLGKNASMEKMMQRLVKT